VHAVHSTATAAIELAVFERQEAQRANAVRHAHYHHTLLRRHALAAVVPVGSESATKAAAENPHHDRQLRRVGERDARRHPHVQPQTVFCRRSNARRDRARIARVSERILNTRRTEPSTVERGAEGGELCARKAQRTERRLSKRNVSKAMHAARQPRSEQRPGGRAHTRKNGGANQRRKESKQ
jgi:hypothetical protein